MVQQTCQIQQIISTLVTTLATRLELSLDSFKFPTKGVAFSSIDFRKVEIFLDHRAR